MIYQQRSNDEPFYLKFFLVAIFNIFVFRVVQEILDLPVLQDHLEAQVALEFKVHLDRRVRKELSETRVLQVSFIIMFF